MLDRYDAEVGSSFDRDEVSPFRLYLELASVPECDFHWKRLTLLIRSEFDSRDRLDGHLTVEFPLTVNQYRVTIPALNEPCKLRVLDGDFRATVQTDNDGLTG